MPCLADAELLTANASHEPRSESNAGSDQGYRKPCELFAVMRDNFSRGEVLRKLILFLPFLLLASPFANRLCAQQTPTASPADPKASLPDSPKPQTDPVDPSDQSGQQTKRILWVIPNFRSVSADTHLPPLGFKDKFWLATQDSFDYSAFIYTGIFAGVAMAQKSQPQFGQGAAGYGIYFAHTFADNTIENYMVGAIVPTLTKEDPRYYTLGKGGFFKRTGYAISRLAITRPDSGNATLNISEFVGAGAAAGIGNAYYPTNQNQWVKTYQRWVSQIIQDGLSNVPKEFWPNVNHAIFHNKY
jgi:hypothetical protein